MGAASATRGRPANPTCEVTVYVYGRNKELPDEILATGIPRDHLIEFVFNQQAIIDALRLDTKARHKDREYVRWDRTINGWSGRATAGFTSTVRASASTVHAPASTVRASASTVRARAPTVHVSASASVASASASVASASASVASASSSRASMSAPEAHGEGAKKAKRERRSSDHFAPTSTKRRKIFVHEDVIDLTLDELEDERPIRQHPLRHTAQGEVGTGPVSSRNPPPSHCTRCAPFDVPEPSREGLSGGQLHLRERTLEFEDNDADIPSKRLRVEDDPQVEQMANAVTAPLEAAHHDDIQMSTADVSPSQDNYETSEEGPDGPPDDHPEPPSEKAPGDKSKTSPSARLAKFAPHHDLILADMFWKDHDPGVPGPCSRPSCTNPATTRCRECRAKAPMCPSCTVEDHINLPLHWIDCWNGTYFERRDLATLGFVIYLGHHGLPCPQLPTANKPIDFIIVHDNGVHACKLIRADLFPATLERTETCFTCELLERFHVDFDISKKSAQDFLRVITRLSGGRTRDGRVKDRYHDFMIASRLYRHLTIVKRSGSPLEVKVPHRDPGDLTVPCFTCPLPGFNLPENWKDTPPKLGYIYRMVLSADGNHSLHKKTKPGDKNDVALSHRHGYFIPHETVASYLQQKYKDTEMTRASVRSQGKRLAVDDVEGDILMTCNDFKVERSQRPGKFRFMDISGILSYTCNHVLFRSGATVDLKRGETWVLNDFALAGALKGTLDLLERGVTYDVVCSYICNIVERFKKSRPDLVPIIEQLKMLLPKMHMHAHQEACQVVYALCYAHGFGLIHGEGVETPWAELNPAGLSTREMTDGARHDALTSLFNYWNWRKVENMGKKPQERCGFARYMLSVDCSTAGHLAKKLGEAYTAQRRTTRYFASLTALAGPDAVMEWISLPSNDDAPTPITYRAKLRAYPDTLYRVRPDNVPSVESAVAQIVQGNTKTTRGSPESNKAAAINQLRNAAALFIRTGIDLEEQLTELRYVRDQRARGIEILDDVLGDRPTWDMFQQKVVKWRKSQRKHMPLLDSLIPISDEYLAADQGERNDSDEEDVDLQEEILGLPSDFNQSERADYDLELLATYELKIRIGMAFDQLGAVRRAVQHRAAHVESKRKNVRGNKNNAAAEQEVRHAAALARLLATRYNHNYDRIGCLRPYGYEAKTDTTPGGRLRRIDLNKDLTISNMVAARTLGESHLSGSWIWSVFDAPQQPHHTRQQNKSKAFNSNTEVDRVQWFRAKAAKHRADEAVNITCAEFRRTSMGYSRYASLWLEAAQRPGICPGQQAYAYKTAAMWDNMRAQCDRKYDESRRADSLPDRLDHTRSIRPYLDKLLDDISAFEPVLKHLEM
ncbi:hypothetical protein NUW54_g1280 [Trametes sanguinea]|uniref:Uncharacterized protein n=1 Tax=Trametes sanguinea TaxID=158606 RepID=A0ACC1Q8N7_9APHY|nr:hypothetical protein NUW54_g1280 [Trametes sanguinea]